MYGWRVVRVETRIQSVELLILPDLDAISKAAADRFLELAHTFDPFTIALSGGSTPRRLYEALSIPPFRDHIPWHQVHVFWGDERCVPQDDPGSNYRSARETMLDHVPIPESNIHRIQGELGPHAAAEAYTRELRDFFGTRWPAFDLILLGMGSDGHTASIFPGSDTLQETEKPAIGVTAQYQDRPARRVTLTPPVINAARTVIFLVTGIGKAETLHAVLKGPYRPHALPAQIVHPDDGHVLWLVDEDAGCKVGQLT